MFRAFHHHRHAGAVQVHICKEDWSLIGSAYLLCESRCEVCGTDGTPCAALKRVEAYNGIGDTHRLPPPAADFEIAPTSSFACLKFTQENRSPSLPPGSFPSHLARANIRLLYCLMSASTPTMFCRSGSTWARISEDSSAATKLYSCSQNLKAFLSSLFRSFRLKPGFLGSRVTPCNALVVMVDRKSVV